MSEADDGLSLVTGHPQGPSIPERFRHYILDIPMCHNQESGCDRPEIEITPEMVEAGAEVLCDFDSQHNRPKEFARRLYLAMEAVRRERA